ncbi:MAG: ribosome-associated translation inhibitor RaiA [Gracilibacteraceae bacterium]|jgi:putative sigma-54 modulation protein|nr:ribosome-associated translation inhibitor RaiA [Gracilibacteraceae bacterium]
MNVLVRGKQFKVTDALKEYAQKRVGKLSKFSDDFSDIHVVLSVERERQKVEVTAPLSGFILRGEEATVDMFTSIDLVVEKLERQMMKYRKRIDRKRGKAQWEEAQLAHDIAAGLVKPDDEEDDDNVVRVKKFPARPMSAEEALMQMNLLSHNFYVFLDMDTEKICVVYRRRDGDYGLLEPEY